MYKVEEFHGGGASETVGRNSSSKRELNKTRSQRDWKVRKAARIRAFNRLSRKGIKEFDAEDGQTPVTLCSWPHVAGRGRDEGGNDRAKSSRSKKPISSC